MNAAFLTGEAEDHVLVFARGDEVMSSLTSWADNVGVGVAGFTGIGAFERATIAYYDRASKGYIEHEIDEHTELMSITGTIALKDGIPHVHAHVALSRHDLSAVGGHLISAIVWPTLEMFVRVRRDGITKSMDEETGLHLIDLREK